ncbi:MAG: RNA methyltransferase [Anaerolineae bacterium]
MTLITSPANERLKQVRLLQRQARARRKQRRLVLEGVRLMTDAVSAGVLPDYVLHAPDPEAAAQDLVENLSAQGVPCLAVTPPLLADLFATETPQGILGVFPWPALPAPTTPGLLLVADGWQDPGNLGTLIRTAAAANLDALILTPGTVDPFNPKALRAGMGGHFRLPLLWSDWERLPEQFPGLQIVVADAAGDVSYEAFDWTQPTLLVVGGEAHGPRQRVRALPHTAVAIPLARGVESLNAAVAASVLLFEAQRQRRLVGSSSRP